MQYDPAVTTMVIKIEIRIFETDSINDRECSTTHA